MARIKGESRMKVLQEDTTFRPVTITLQTPYELSTFYTLLMMIATSRNLVAEDVRGLAEVMKNSIDDKVEM